MRGFCMISSEPSPDPLLQWRLVFYHDAQVYRLGVNYHQIPVNCPFRSMQYHPQGRDGASRTDSNGGAEASYYPNSFTVPPPATPDIERANWTIRHIKGVLGRTAASRSASTPDGDYIQAREFFLYDLSDQERANLFTNTAQPLSKVTRPDIAVRYLIGMYKVHPTLAAGILTAMQPLLAAGKDEHQKVTATITLETIQRLADSMPHASIPEQGYIPRPVSY